MDSDVKEIKMLLKYCKKALKMIDEMYTWKYLPLKHPLEEKQHLENQIEMYEKQLGEMRGK